MPRQKTARDPYQLVTDQVIAQMEQGASYERGWLSNVSNEPPVNGVTGHRYRGVNIPLLWFAGFGSNQWASYRQWQAKGAQVQKGQRGTTIVYYGSAPCKKAAESEAGPDGEEARQYRFLKCSTVFNAEQVEGFEAAPIEHPGEAERIAAAEAFITATGATIRHQGDKAFYAPSQDLIVMPAIEAFQAVNGSSATENYYRTKLHELGHWTGHDSRCARDFSKCTRWGDSAYAAEELVAELASAFVMGELGISPAPIPNHAGYIDSWLKVLKHDKRAIFTAASKASAAADYLRGLQDGPAMAAAA